MSAPSVLYPTGTPISMPTYQVTSQGVPLGGAGLSAPNAAFPTGTPFAYPVYLTDSNGNPYSMNLIYNIADYGTVIMDGAHDIFPAIKAAMVAATATGGIV